MDKTTTRNQLVQRLTEANCFWSYDGASVNSITDDQVIEKTLVHLDLEDIHLLFDLYGTARVKRIWLERLVPQGDYLYALNRFFAWYYFNIKNPDQYLRSQYTKHLHKLSE